MPNNTPTESVEQIKVVQYLDILERQGKVLWYTASANWQFQKSMAVKMKMKREWVRAWMPDIMILFQKYLVFIEMKRLKWSTTTKEQKKAIEAINIVWDPKWIVAWYIAHWFDEAKTIIDFYIK